jgi:NAD(P)-dependent dehydrogenase (short-subunit alcohol dehydrogenase family)
MCAPCCLTGQEQVDALARMVADEFGRLDVLVNNAGASTLTFHYFDHLPKPAEETVDDIRSVPAAPGRPRTPQTPDIQ